jgi:hypothetical protein
MAEGAAGMGHPRGSTVNGVYHGAFGFRKDGEAVGWGPAKPKEAPHRDPSGVFAALAVVGRHPTWRLRRRAGAAGRRVRPARFPR